MRPAGSSRTRATCAAAQSEAVSPGRSRSASFSARLTLSLMARSRGYGGQVERRDAVGVDEDVDRHDPVFDDLEGHDRERPAIAEDDAPGRAVDERAAPVEVHAATELRGAGRDGLGPSRDVDGAGTE